MASREANRSSRGLRAFLRGPIQRANEDARRHQLEAPDAFDYKTAVVLLTAVVALTLQEYLFARDCVYDAVAWVRTIGMTDLADRLDALVTDPHNWQLAELGWWAIGRVLTFVLIPLLVIKLVLRGRLRDYGMRGRGALAGAWVYAVLFAFMLPVVYFYSQTQSFQHKYPFYRLGPDDPMWPRFWMWQMLYAAQFVSLEIFFRGFMVHGTKHRFGFYAVFVMTIPYVMIHFGKPMPETFSAIGAGVILGFMSIKTGAVWLGAAIHISVAMSMDFFSLWHRGFF